MSARSPGSVMLRAATAASGGTGAPAWTYCSTWAWTERMSAWTSTSVDGCSVSSSIRARMNGSVCANPCRRIRAWPWMMARTVPSWSWTTWAFFATVNTPNRWAVSVMSSWSAWRWVTSAIRPPSATAAFSAATLLSRPTCSGTIISGKITVSRSATSGSSVMVMVRSSSGVDARFGIGSPNGWLRGGSLGSCFSGRGRLGCGSALGALLGDSFGVEAFQDPGPETLFELEQDADAGEVDPEVLGQVANPHDPPEVVLRVEPDVGRRSCRADEPLFLVDPQRPRMHADDARRHTDDVDGSRGVAI